MPASPSVLELVTGCASAHSAAITNTLAWADRNVAAVSRGSAIIAVGVTVVLMTILSRTSVRVKEWIARSFAWHEEHDAALTGWGP